LRGQITRRRRSFRCRRPAKTNVSKMLDELITRSRQLRQEEITNEIIEIGARPRELLPKLAFRGQYSLIEAGAPHSSAVTQEAHSVLVGMSRTRRSQRSQVFRTLWRWTYSKNACSSCPSMSQKPKLSS
jgi:hypothetical protein